MRVFGERSIRRKLTLLMIAVSGVALLVASCAFMVNHYFALRASKITELHALADVLASNSTVAVRFQKADSASDLLASLRKRPTVEYAALLDKDGKIFVSYRRDAQVKVPQIEPGWTGERFEQHRHVSVALPITEDGEVLGTIFLHASSKDLHEQIIRDVGITSVVIVLSLLIAVLVSARLQRIVSQPILNLAATAQQVTEQADYSIRVEPKSTDEIGSLYRQFNQMLQRIQTGEEELRRLTAIIETTSDMVSVATPDGQVTYLNRAGRRLLGLGKDEELTRKQISDVHPESAFQVVDSEGIPAAIADGIWEGETAILGPDGEAIPVSQVIMSHRTPDGEINYLSTIIRDITERKRAAEEREKLITDLEAKNAELEQFAYTVSHDLKTPLITIKGYAGMLQQDLDEGNAEDVKDDLGRISDAADKMNELLKQVLELSRIGRVTHPPQDVPFANLVDDVTRLLAGTLVGGRVDLQIGSDLPLLYGDKIRLAEVLQNLIENALKYMGGQPNPRIEIGARQDGEETVCFVRDNGMGIDPRYHQTIFGLFNQLDQSVGGTGVGLALVKRIIEFHGGRIWVESEGEGQGSTFCFVLPERAAKPVPETV